MDETRAADQRVTQHQGFSRLLLEWTPLAGQAFRLALSPTFTTREGEDRLQTGVIDPLEGDQRLLTAVSGLEWQLRALPWAGAPGAAPSGHPDDQRLEAVAFVKHYLYRADAQVADGTAFRDVSRHLERWGAGGGLRYALARWVDVKASYEHTVRLPRPDEVFGDGMLVDANLDLQPEEAHAANLGARFGLDGGAGALAAEANGFLRDVDDLIVLLGVQSRRPYENVYHARGLGLEGSAAWMAPGGWLRLEGSATWQDLRNVSDAGTFASTRGDRVPNRPWLFGSWGATLQRQGLFTIRDSLEPFYQGRYVHSFFRAWESVGQAEHKQVVPSQCVHDAGVTYAARSGARRVSATLEVENLSDARVTDFLGVQRPGRTFAVKLGVEL
ncbi:MAG: TonB-dependent receptor [Anaeromyxobacter sp.]